MNVELEIKHGKFTGKAAVVDVNLLERRAPSIYAERAVELAKMRSEPIPGRPVTEP